MRIYILTSILVLSGCSIFDKTPEEVRAVDEEADKAHARIVATDEAAIQTLLNAYLIHEKQIIEGNLEDDMEDPENQEPVEVLVLPEPEENGLIDPAKIEASLHLFLEPEMAISLAQDYGDALDRSRTTAEVFERAWRKTRDGNEEDYQEFREFLRRWRDRPAFGPDELRDIFRGIESELPNISR